MAKYWLAAFIFVTISQASAQEASPDSYFAAPVVPSRTTIPGDAPFGAIVYDYNAGAFYGLIPQAAGLTTQAWVPISSPNNSNRSSVSCNTGNGLGTNTGNKIRVFSSCTTTGSDIIYLPSASNSNNGDLFTINTAGLYAMSYSDRNPTVSTQAIFGFSFNADSALTTVIGALGRKTSSCLRRKSTGCSKTSRQQSS